MKLEKRSNPPQGLATHSSPSPEGERCGICNKTASKRLTNAWRTIDICADSKCVMRGTYWASNKPYSSRVDVPTKVFRAPPPYKFLSRKADAVAKPPATGRAANGHR